MQGGYPLQKMKNFRNCTWNTFPFNKSKTHPVKVSSTTANISQLCAPDYVIGYLHLKAPEHSPASYPALCLTAPLPSTPYSSH